MQVRSFARLDGNDTEVSGAVHASDFTSAQKFLLLSLNLIPLVHVLGLVAAVYFWGNSWTAKMLIAGSGLYLLPPLIVQCVLSLGRFRQGVHPMGSRNFFLWWFAWQCQVLFCRLNFLEEILRLVPGLYSFWLRLWGARIGQLTYWAPGVLILDRPFVHIGDNVIFGAGVRLNGHVASNDEKGKPALAVATIHIGDHCQIGGYSLLTAGTVLEPGQTTKALFLSVPFSIWKDGRRIREKNNPEKRSL